MYIEQIYTGCLAHGAYYIESNGEAAIIDPLREVKPYIQKANSRNAKIKYVFETHFHADFVSGHVELNKQCGAKVVYGPTAQPAYDAYVAKDNEVFELGYVKIQLLHTPGHTMESSCFLLIDESGNPHSIFTGDTLFIGDVGRPDLAVKTDLTKEDLAGHLYDSLHNKILTLPDHLIIYPGHGAGSACGKNMSNETTDTLGNQRKTNYALKQPDRASFIKAVTDGLLPPPYYFPHNAAINKKGYTLLETLMESNIKPLTPQQVIDAVEKKKAIVLDTRKGNDFIEKHIPNSLFIGIDGDFAPWAGTVITNIQQAIVLVCDPGREEEILTRLARVGYENVLGYLEGGVNAWQNAGFPVEKLQSISAGEFLNELNSKPVQMIDVRKQSEYENGCVKNAVNYPLAYLHQHFDKFKSDQKYYIYCAGGYRSLIACSLLKQHGIHSLVNVLGGFNEIKKTSGFPIVQLEQA